MARVKVGDRVSVKVKGGKNTFQQSYGTLDIPAGGELSVTGKIIDDRGDRWLVKLDVSVGGKDLMLVFKSPDDMAGVQSSEPGQ